MRISDWSSDVCSSDLDLGPGTWARDLGKEKGRPAMGLQPSREVFITCAVTGAGDTTGRSDKVPVTPRQIADSCIEAAADGSHIVHIHLPDPASSRPVRDPAPTARGGRSRPRAGT